MGVKRKLRRLSSVGSHDLTEAAGETRRPFLFAPSAAQRGPEEIVGDAKVNPIPPFGP